MALSVTQDELVKREGLYYKKFSDVPFSRKVTGMTHGTLKNGVLDDVYHLNFRFLITINIPLSSV